MNDTDLSNELRAIRAALEARPGSTITGGQIFDLIRKTSPELDIRSLVAIPKGSGAVSEFIRTYLGNVLERFGKQGADDLYHIQGREFSGPYPASPEVWRTFISPNATKHLVLSNSTNLLKVKDTPASTSENELEVPQATFAEHDRIRSEFSATLSKTAAAELTRNVPPDAEFSEWIAALREHHPDLLPRWGQYRREQLARLFATRITDLKLDDTIQRELLEQIKKSEEAAYDMLKGSRAASSKKEERAPVQIKKAVEKAELARKLAYAAIGSMTYEELRSLKLPLGAVIDAI